MTGSGPISVRLKLGTHGITDLAGNALGSIGASGNVTWGEQMSRGRVLPLRRLTSCLLADGVNPTVTSGMVFGSGMVSPSNAATLRFNVSFSERVQNVTVAAFTVGGSASGARASSIVGGGSGPYW